MSMRMLIDARHPEETRVAVVKGNRIEEFDFESAEHKQLKGNIYLAKVTRVEPSLQAAFVDYGGNRHGFLAFSEIHPDYYQIPKADREALLREEAEHAAEEERLRAAELDEPDAPAEDEVTGEEFDADAATATATTTEAGTGSSRSPVDESAACSSDGSGLRPAEGSSSTSGNCGSISSGWSPSWSSRSACSSSRACSCSSACRSAKGI